MRSTSQMDSPGLNSDLDAVYSNFKRQHTLSQLPTIEKTDQTGNGLSLNGELSNHKDNQQTSKVNDTKKHSRKVREKLAFHIKKLQNKSEDSFGELIADVSQTSLPQ